MVCQNEPIHYYFEFGGWHPKVYRSCTLLCRLWQLMRSWQRLVDHHAMVNKRLVFNAKRCFHVGIFWKHLLALKTAFYALN